jgi:thioredoxin/glutathione reductase (selenoprotein)
LSTCFPIEKQVKELFNSLQVGYHAIEWDQVEGGADVRQSVIDKVGRTSVPQVFVAGQLIGGCDDTFAAHESGKLADLIKDIPQYDYDLVVIGGGSGGLAASKEAARLGKRVALLDYVKPTPIGTSWGLGGTCVNVGCIPKKLMHQAALIGQTIRHSTKFGWATKDSVPLADVLQHNWKTMVDSVQANIKSSNFKYRVAVREQKVQYLNAYGTLVDEHTIKLTDKKNVEKLVTSKHFLIATGERPKYPTDVEGALEHAITSDDLFSLPHCPGKTLVVGASYVALECAGFLRGFALDVTVMVRSILLRGFDEEMAEKVGEYMAEEGVRFARQCVPTKIELIEKGEDGALSRYLVTGAYSNGESFQEEFNTVLFAIGRKPCTDTIGLENVGVKVAKNGKIPVVNEQTNVPNIYAVGDILEGKPELTPVAIDAGLRLVRRLYANSTQQCDYDNIATTVFTPLEYGCVGLTEQQAIERFGADNIEVYIQFQTPFEWTIAHNLDNQCYAKLITVLNQNVSSHRIPLIRLLG